MADTPNGSCNVVYRDFSFIGGDVMRYKNIIIEHDMSGGYRWFHDNYQGGTDEPDIYFGSWKTSIECMEEYDQFEAMGAYDD